jgi:phosphatidylserine decarboxylase
VGRGERLGMIKFGSRVDVFLPPTSAVRVQMRDKVKVALTVAAVLEEKA